MTETKEGARLDEPEPEHILAEELSTGGFGFEIRLEYTGDPTEEREWFFTFGAGQSHPVTGEPLDRRFLRIRGAFWQAREEMMARFGPKWCGQYPSSEDAGVERFELVELEQTDGHVEVLKARQSQIRARVRSTTEG